MKTQTLTDRQEIMEMELSEVKFFSTGAASGCSECGMPDKPTDEDHDIYNEGFFSWSTCDLCHDSAGGTRYPAHGFDKTTGALIHYEICTDCLLDINC